MNDQKPIKLFVYRFHDYFDGLIGLDLLEQWHSKIDLKSRLLSTEFASNPIHMYESQPQPLRNLIETTIPAQSSRLVYKKGKCNTNADALSRIEIHNEEMESVVVNISSDSSSRRSSMTLTAPDDRPLISLSSTDTAPSETPLDSPRSRSSSTDTAPSLTPLLSPALNPNPIQMTPLDALPPSSTVHTSAEHPVLNIPITDDPLNKFKRQLIIKITDSSIKPKPKISNPFDTFRRTVTYVSSDTLQEDLVSIVKNHIDPKLRTAIFIDPPDQMYTVVPVLQNTFKNSSMNLILAKREVQNVNEYLLQQDIISKYHEGKTNHRGINETYLSLSQRYFWPKLKESITNYINSCPICGRAKYDRDPVRPEFRIVPPPSKPFEHAHADVLTIEQDKYLTIIDSFSKYAQAYCLTDCTAPNIVKAFMTFATHHGFPLILTTDNGTEFTNQVFREFLKLHNIQHHTVAPHAPNENGLIERFHSTLLEHLRLLKLQHSNELTQNLISYALIAYNSSIHSLTKCRPYDLITGHFDPRNPIDLNLSERLLQLYLQDHKDKMQTVYKIVHDESSSNRNCIMTRRNLDREPENNYDENQEVFVKNPAANRQKLAARYTKDNVRANLPIHIYTTRKRGPVAKNRLKRTKKTKDRTLLQDSNTPRDAGASPQRPRTSSEYPT